MRATVFTFCTQTNQSSPSAAPIRFTFNISCTAEVNFFSLVRMNFRIENWTKTGKSLLDMLDRRDLQSVKYIIFIDSNITSCALNWHISRTANNSNNNIKYSNRLIFLYVLWDHRLNGEFAYGRNVFIQCHPHLLCALLYSRQSGMCNNNAAEKINAVKMVYFIVYWPVSELILK